MTIRQTFSRRQFLATTAAAGATLAAPSLAFGQNYPSGPINLVCGFSAGGTTDALARVLANFMSEKFGQPVVVENRTGAAGAIGLSAVVNAKPDGRTLLFSAVGQIAVIPHTQANLAVDPVKGLEHISMLAEGDFVLTVNSQVPANTVEEFIALAKEKPGQLFYGTSGAGGNLHLFIEAFNLAAGIQLKGVHYSGGSTLMPDVLNNQVQLALNSYPVAAPYVENGQLKALMILGKQRNEKLPNVPVAADVGLDDLTNCNDWFALHAPAGTPSDIIELLADTVAEAADSPAMQDRLEAASLRKVANRPAEFAERIQSDYALFGDVAERAGVKAG